LLQTLVILNDKEEYIWDSSTITLGDINSVIAPEYTKEIIDTIINVEISSTDLNLISFFTGVTELTLGLYINEQQNYKVTSLPEEFRLPDKIFIDFLNSDAIRICLEENVFSNENLNDFLDNERIYFEQRIKHIFNNIELDSKTSKDALIESLNWDGKISEMDEKNPIQIVSYSYSSYPALFSISFIPPSFKIQEKSFTFKGIENQNVTYRMEFPPGLTIHVKDSLEKAIIQTTEDGKTFFSISFDPSESELSDGVTFTIIPSALFIIGIFMPCILSLIITIILVLVIYIIRRKRKKNRGIIVKHEPQNYNDLESQDYYVPPPPPSIRK